jgi:peptidoglycan/xylan/chitin deacetylase (PgdA/CDA1 family)
MSTQSRRAFVGGSVAAALTAVAGCSTGGQPKARGTRPSRPSVAPNTTPPETHESTTPTSIGAGRATFVAQGPQQSSQVALTFHTNGNVGLAHQLLDLVDMRKVPVTAFIVGNWLDQHPDWGKRLVDGGHELANHTYTHPTFARLDATQMADEISRCRDALLRSSGSNSHFFRPSGTANGTDMPLDMVMAAAGAAGYATVLGYDVDPSDYQNPGPAVVARRTINGLHPGAIVSLHFGHQGTIRALPAILDAIEQRGLTAVTASGLLSS